MIMCEVSRKITQVCGVALLENSFVNKKHMVPYSASSRAVWVPTLDFISDLLPSSNISRAYLASFFPRFPSPFVAESSWRLILAPSL